MEQALEWAENAAGTAFPGQESFATLVTQAMVLERLGRAAEAEPIVAEALAHPIATAPQIYGYASQLLAQGQTEEAFTVFQRNAERFPESWLVSFGLAQGYSAKGENETALAHARKALEGAPSGFNRTFVLGFIQTLEASSEGP